VGVLLNPSLGPLLGRLIHRLDYLAAIPDRGWIDRGRNAEQRFQALPSFLRMMEEASRERPVVLHSVGLSICSADLFDEEYAHNMIEWAEMWNAAWISDHLSFSRIGTGHEKNAAITLPVPYDEEVLEMLIPRVRYFTERLACPFLLENNVYYVRYPDQEMTEEEFLNRLCSTSGCGVLLDLHNLYTNSVNHHLRATDYIDRLDLSNVTEIHIAGGMPMLGFHTDSHTGPVIRGVWDLLEYTVPRTPNLRGVTFEFHESSFGAMGVYGVLEQVEQARAIVAYAGKDGARDVAQGIPAGPR